MSREQTGCGELPGDQQSLVSGSPLTIKQCQRLETIFTIFSWRNFHQSSGPAQDQLF